MNKPKKDFDHEADKVASLIKIEEENGEAFFNGTSKLVGLFFTVHTESLHC